MYAYTYIYVQFNFIQKNPFRLVQIKCLEITKQNFNNFYPSRIA